MTTPKGNRKKKGKEKKGEDVVVAGMASAAPCRTPEDLREEVIRRARLIRPMLGALAEGFTYCSLEEYLVDRGTAFTEIIRAPEWGRTMRKAKCFQNAWSLTLWSGGHLRYAEGFAGRKCARHAWCVTQEGKVLDPTWSRPDFTYPGPYFGAVFTDLHMVDAFLCSMPEHYARSEQLCAAFPGFRTVAMSKVFTDSGPMSLMMETYGPWLTAQHIAKSAERLATLL